MLGGEAGVGQGFKYFMSGIEVGRVNVAARGAGIARAALDDSLATPSSARRSASTIAHHQAVQLMLAKMATRAEAARLLVVQAAAGEGARRARRPRGGHGEVLRDRGRAGERARLHAHPRRLRLLAEFRPERYYRDAPLLLIGEGSNEIQQLVIARRLLERRA